ncbi:Der GTPase-activating protein YihI [uncultured Oceanisphaera sp.]|uniref:Der GTPase-activating protein YihI n=1 Tax=uncultured Oceanisphaera sp. TaxID=353858 RepID=UPI00262E5869|nr:Der GTPase-activating protein YihI [uncultured Oceanisphaera sp.]
MTRIKKTRTPGQIGARKESRETAEQSKDRKRKAKRKGLAPGSRHNTGESGQQHGGSKTPRDPRLGSKKPIALVQGETTKVADSSKPAKPAKAPKPARVTPVIDTDVEALTPEQELEQLENNERLNTLLDKVDAGEKLGKNDAGWLDQTLARHQQLLEELGLLEEDEEEPAEGDDLWTRFMDADLDPAQYEDKEDKS